MYDYSRYIRKNTNIKHLSNAQKQADIEAINNLLFPLGVSVTDSTESCTTIRYKARLHPDCNIKKILSMRENLCVALNDDTVRLYREKADLIIEKHGADNTVRLGDLDTPFFWKHTGLPIMLGIGADGLKTYMDLRKAVHALIAGTTGSGKSVLENAIICSLLMKYPDIVIYGIDTKRVEFQAFRSAPNFNLITDPQKAVMELARLCDEMEKRYAMLMKANASDIDEYDRKGGNMNPIVVIIDEFADLMLLSGKTVEEYVVRLAQKARACGIHLIIATQRPTRDVITGLIKANIPTKICLKVTSALDSRIVLDRNGGEHLAGHGDMLYLGNGAFDPIRVQGCFVETQEKINIAHVADSRTTGKPIPQQVKREPLNLNPVTRDLFRKLYNTK